MPPRKKGGNSRTNAKKIATRREEVARKSTPRRETLIGRSQPSVKLQRWIDMLAALLSRRYPSTLENLVEDVPAYGHAPAGTAARRRMFERDKAELRQLGVPIETVMLDDGESVGYRLTTHDFYLPYLVAKGSNRAESEPTKVDRYGYRALPYLVFEPEELRFVALAAARLRSLESASLSAAATSLIRKLNFDLPIGVMHPASEDGERVIAPRVATTADVFDALIEAVTHRKRAEIDYYAIGADQMGVRTVEPYGLLLVSGSWYLVARDVTKDALRTYRASRIARVRLNTRQPSTPDYSIPREFVLREYAKSKQAWEIGDGDLLSAVIEFRGEGGGIAAAARLGTIVPGMPMRRRFEVRRVDTFARWLLSFGGEALPISPAIVCDAFDRVAREAALAYARPASERTANRKLADMNPPRTKQDADAGDSGSTQPASAQLLRLLATLPILAAKEHVDLDQIAMQVGVPATTLIHDLHALSDRRDAPAGFVDSVQIYLEHRRVSVVTPHFLRPMRLGRRELLALELGLAMLRRESAPEDRVWIDRARVRLHGAAASVGGDAGDIATGNDSPRMDVEGLGMLPEQNREHLTLIRQALVARRKVRLQYRGASAAAQVRTIRVYGTVYAAGMWYAIAYCETRKAVRRFRLDRIDSAEVLRAEYVIPKTFRFDNELASHRVLSHDVAPEFMRVRYTTRIARWIAEREGCTLSEDGSVELEHPVLDVEWAVRYVLQYGGEAEVLTPVPIRDAIRLRLEAIISRRRDPS